MPTAEQTALENTSLY